MGQRIRSVAAGDDVLKAEEAEALAANPRGRGGGWGQA